MTDQFNDRQMAPVIAASRGHVIEQTTKSGEAARNWTGVGCAVGSAAIAAALLYAGARIAKRQSGNTTRDTD